MSYMAYKICLSNDSCKKLVKWLLWSKQDEITCLLYFNEIKKKMKETKENLWNQKPQIENDVLWISDYFALIRKESGSAFI